MRSTTLCDYQVLRDSSFTLDPGNGKTEETVHFERPLDMFHGDGSRMPILSFAYRTVESGRLEIDVNHREVISVNFGTSKTRTYNEPFRAQTAFPQGSSSLAQVPVKFRTQSATIVISTVILFYQVDITREF